MMTFTNLLIEKSRSTAVVTVNRPKVLNALDARTLQELEKAFVLLGNDSEVDVIILTGAGDKAFVAGADIAFMKDLDALAAREFALFAQRVLSRIENTQQPVIAAVNGYALGGGCELAMACDIRIASETAKFGQPEVGLGIIPGFAGTQRLPRLVGKGPAKEIIFTGEFIDAREAWRIGLVNRVVPPEQLMESARQMADKIAARSRVAVRLAKQALNEGLEMDSDRAYAHEANLFGLCFTSADQKEGMAAFLEKRAPRFSKKT